MPIKKKYCAKEKLNIIIEYKDGKSSLDDLHQNYKIAKSTLYDWMRKYEKQGINGLMEAKTWKKYSKELKYSAVLDYLSGNHSIIDVVSKYEISSKSVLDKWIKLYNSHKKLKDTGKGLSQIMTKSRVTTIEERIEIVEHCINNEKNYQQTADIFNVSYQQVYSWVKKYQNKGKKGLEDKRGRNKVEEDLTDEEKIRRDIKIIKSENERLRAENSFLKKLEELERRRY